MLGLQLNHVSKRNYCSVCIDPIMLVNVPDASILELHHEFLVQHYDWMVKSQHPVWCNDKQSGIGIAKNNNLLNLLLVDGHFKTWLLIGLAVLWDIQKPGQKMAVK